MNTAKISLWRVVLGAAFLALGSAHANAQQVASELTTIQQHVLAEDKLPTGQRLFEQRCAICHGSEPYHPATRMLEMRYGSGHGSLLGRESMTPEAVKAIVRGGMREMFPFRVVDLSDEDLDAIARYVAGGARK